MMGFSSILSICVHVFLGCNGLGSVGQSTAPQQPGREAAREAQQGLAAGSRELCKPTITWQKILGMRSEVEKVLCRLLYNEWSDQSNFYDMSPMSANNLKWELHCFPLGGGIWFPELTNLNLKCFNNFEWNATKVCLLGSWRTNDKIFKWTRST